MADLLELREIAAQLRELRRTSPSDKSGLDAWDAAARNFSEAVSIRLPPQVMHYLHDADIRIKDPDYRAAQDEMIDGVISDLEAGIVSAPIGTTVSFHPRWIGVAALVVLAVVCWVATR